MQQISYTTIRPGRGVVVVEVVGELDSYTAPTMRSGIRAAISASDTRHLRVDLTGLSYIDSSGISALVRCRAEADGRGIDMVVSHPQPQPLKVLRILGLTEHLGVTTEGSNN